MKPSVWLLAGSLIVTGGAIAQENVETVVYRDTEYVSGKAGLNKKIKGQLMLQEQEVSFRDNDGNKLFGIPIKIVKDVSNSSDYVTINTETPEAAEAIVFKCRKKTSQAMTANIQLLQKKAGVAQ